MNLDVITELGYDPKTLFPAAPGGSFGTFGGLGGLGGAPQSAPTNDFGNWLRAIGGSLMTSPRNHPLAGVPQYLAYYNKQSTDQQTASQKRSAIAYALMQAGATREEAERLSGDPAAAELWLKQKQKAAALASDQAFTDNLSSIGGDTAGFTEADEETGGHIAAPTSSARLSPTLLDNRPLADVTEQPVPPASSAENSSISVAPQEPSEIDALWRIRDQYVRAAANANTAEQRAKAQLYIGAIDKRIDRVEEETRLTEAQRDLREINNQRLREGLPPYRLDEWQQLKARSGATTIDMKGPSKYDETFSAEMAKRAIAIQDEADAAQRVIATSRVMEEQMADPNFYSGAGAGAVMNLKRVAKSLGLPGADGIDSIESFNAMSKQAALDAMGGSLGTGFSNADRSFVEEQVANLGNTTEGNVELIRIQRALAERKLEIARLARAYAEENEGRIDNGFYDRLARWAENNPLFPDSGKTDRAGGATGRSRPRATNPKTGETLEWDGSQWSPVR